MKTNLYWVDTGTPGRLATMARPRAGDWLVVVSLLTAEEIAELQLEEEQRASEAVGLQFHSFPIPDRQVPSAANTHRFIHALSAELIAGRAVAIHCRMGIGRASLIAAAVLRVLGISGEDALTRIQNARGLSVPDTEEQREWILRFSSEA